jgi:Ca2+-transporting ATPase
MNEILGLTDVEVKSRRERDGLNELPTSGSRGLLKILLEILEEPMMYLLLGCGVIYAVLGDQTEAYSLLFFLVVILVITVYQEAKAERALEALRDLSSPRALVIRNGVKLRIPGREVVRDDFVVLSEGDRVPADGVLIASNNLAADESLLTGESVPADKRVEVSKEVRSPSAPDQSLLDATRVFSGTTIVRGSALMRVSEVGAQTQLGKIGKSLNEAEEEPSFLERETRALVKKLAWVSAALCFLVVVAYGLTRGNWLEGFLAGLALAMAILPNELPAVLVIFLALGAWRLSKRQVLTRRIAAVETLGSATVICVDKTGTLTLNQMQIQKLFSRDHWLDLRHHKAELPEEFHELLEYGILASRSEPFDPMEKAIQQSSVEYLSNTEHLHPDWSLLREYPLTQDLLAVSQVWKSDQTKDYVIGAKGAPEAIMDLCHLSEEVRAMLSLKIKEMAQEGLRVIGVARAVFSEDSLPNIQHDFEFEFLGFLGLADPVRAGVFETVQECYSAGIRVMMITGDHRETAKSIAKQIGLKSADEVITGEELKRLTEEELRLRLKTVNIFSRMSPDQKLELVKALKASGEVVAMTGDGVNDAPALKAADIGIAMGSRGTDVARESASLVLVQDDFQSIVDAVRAGRRVYTNLRNAMSYLLSVHIPIAGLSMVPILLGLPLVLLPIHIAFLHLIIEPASSIFFEAEAETKDLMKAPPRNPKLRLFSADLLVPSLIQGLFVLLVILTTLLISLNRGEVEARTFTFCTLIVANLGLILSQRSWTQTILQGFRSRLPNPSLKWILGGAVVLLGLVLYVPALREVFRFTALKPSELLICLLVGSASILWFEFRKWQAKKV